MLFYVSVEFAVAKCKVFKGIVIRQASWDCVLKVEFWKRSEQVCKTYVPSCVRACFILLLPEPEFFDVRISRNNIKSGLDAKFFYFLFCVSIILFVRPHKFFERLPLVFVVYLVRKLHIYFCRTVYLSGFYKIVHKFTELVQRPHHNRIFYALRARRGKICFSIVGLNRCFKIVIRVARMIKFSLYSKSFLIEVVPNQVVSAQKLIFVVVRIFSNGNFQIVLNFFINLQDYIFTFRLAIFIPLFLSKQVLCGIFHNRFVPLFKPEIIVFIFECRLKTAICKNDYIVFVF